MFNPFTSFWRWLHGTTAQTQVITAPSIFPDTPVPSQKPDTKAPLVTAEPAPAAPAQAPMPAGPATDGLFHPKPNPKPAPKPVIKTRINGLTSMGVVPIWNGTPFINDMAMVKAFPGLLVGAIIAVRLCDLTPKPCNLAAGEVPWIDTSLIDGPLKTLAALNAALPQGMEPCYAGLRLFGGTNMPAWVLQQLGSVTMKNANAQNGMPSTYQVGPFWTTAYQAYERAVSNALAALYDTDPLLSKICAFSCCTLTGEPMITPFGPENNPALEKAGCTDAEYQARLQEAIQGGYSGWKQTFVDFSFSALETMAPHNTTAGLSFVNSLMDLHRSTFGARAILANHGIQSSANASSQGVQMLTDMHTLGAPIAFQTQSPTDNLDECVTNAEKLGCTELELWSNKAAKGPANYTGDDLVIWRGDILSNSPA